MGKLAIMRIHDGDSVQSQLARNGQLNLWARLFAATRKHYGKDRE
jgi:hypothetical protein